MTGKTVRDDILRSIGAFGRYRAEAVGPGQITEQDWLRAQQAKMKKRTRSPWKPSGTPTSIALKRTGIVPSALGAASKRFYGG